MAELLDARQWKTCFACRMPSPEVEDHHVVPRKEGGADDADNMVPLCKACHTRVTWGFANVTWLQTLMQELASPSCPIWARILFVKLAEYLAIAAKDANAGFTFEGLRHLMEGDVEVAIQIRPRKNV